MDTFFLDRAIELAITNVNCNSGGPFGAVIVLDNEIIASGFNQVTLNNDPTAHAEITAIRAACGKLQNFQLSDCVLYSSCEPCPMCLGAIYWARLAKVFYAGSRQQAADAGFDDSFIYEQVATIPGKRTIPMLQIDRPEAEKPFSIWKSLEDKIDY